MLRWGLDDTRGVVIGVISTKKHYTFHDKSGVLFGSGNFETDQDAADYIKDKCPAHFKAGVELRCYKK